MSVLCVILKSHMNSPTSKIFSITDTTGFFSINRQKEVAFIYTACRSKQWKLMNIACKNIIKPLGSNPMLCLHLVLWHTVELHISCFSLPGGAHRDNSVFKQNTYKHPKSDTLLRYISYPLRGHTWYAIIIPKYALNKRNHSLLLISLTFFCEESLCSLSGTS